MDYGKLSKKELIQECELRNLSFSSSWTKERLENALIEYDNNNNERQTNTNRNTQPIETYDKPQPNNNPYSGQPVLNGGVVVDGQVYVRGYRHDTFIAFLVNVGMSFVTGIIMFVSFFYWPLIRKWLNFTAEYRWGWTITFDKWVSTIFFAFCGVLLCITLTGAIVGIPMILFIFSYFKGCNTARASREYYKQNIYLNNNTFNQ